MKKHTSGGNNSAAKGFYERIFYTGCIKTTATKVNASNSVIFGPI